jgi:hypothetical protein
LVERNLAKVEVASSSLVSRSSLVVGVTRRFLKSKIWRDSKAVMQRIANPSSPVRLWIAPPNTPGAGIAQLVERNLAKVEVASSSLVSRSTVLPAKVSSPCVAVHRFHSCDFAKSQAGIAQLVERNLAKVEVASSSLVSRSTVTSQGFIALRCGSQVLLL